MEDYLPVTESQFNTGFTNAYYKPAFNSVSLSTGFEANLSQEDLRSFVPDVQIEFGVVADSPQYGVTAQGAIKSVTDAVASAINSTVGVWKAVNDGRITLANARANGLSEYERAQLTNRLKLDAATLPGRFSVAQWAAIAGVAFVAYKVATGK